MKIILDVMGGDNAPDANIKGAINAINKVKAEVILVGKEEIIRSKIKEFFNQNKHKRHFFYWCRFFFVTIYSSVAVCNEKGQNCEFQPF